MTQQTGTSSAVPPPRIGLAPGPRPTPLQLRVVRGTATPEERRALEQHNRAAPPLETPPRPPRELSREGKKEWKRVAAILCRMRVLTELDLPMLLMYCHHFTAYVEAIENYNRLGALVRTAGERGNVMRNPWSQVAQSHATILRVLLQEFGMSPASRVRLVASRAAGGGDGGEGGWNSI